MTTSDKQGPQTLEDRCNAELRAPYDPRWEEIIRSTTAVKVMLVKQSREDKGRTAAEDARDPMES